MSNKAPNNKTMHVQYNFWVAKTRAKNILCKLCYRMSSRTGAPSKKFGITISSLKIGECILPYIATISMILICLQLAGIFLHSFGLSDCEDCDSLF